jgi:hypothetical protein
MATFTELIQREMRAADERDVITSSLEAYSERMFGLENKWFHKELYRLLQNEKRVLGLIPRGFGKSTIACGIFPTWAIGRNPNLRIIIASNTFALSKMYLRQIEQILLMPAYQRIFGNLVPPSRTSTWTDMEKIVIRDKIMPDASFLALGVGGATINRRADIIIGDDLVTHKNSATPAQREALRTWFWECLYPILEPDGQIVILGTRYSSEDLYAELIQKWSKGDYEPPRVAMDPEEAIDILTEEEEEEP